MIGPAFSPPTHTSYAFAFTYAIKYWITRTAGRVVDEYLVIKTKSFMVV